MLTPDHLTGFLAGYIVGMIIAIIFGLRVHYSWVKSIRKLTEDIQRRHLCK